MDEHVDYENYLKLMSLDYTHNLDIVPSVHEYDIQHFVPVADLNESHSLDPPQHSWVHDQETSQNYIKFMTENSTYNQRSSFGGVSDQGISLSGFGRRQSEVVKNNKGKEPKIERNDYNTGRVSSWNVMPSRHVPNRSNLDYSMTGSGLFIDKTKRCTVPMQTNDTTWKDRTKIHDCRVHESRSEAKVEPPYIAPKPSYKTFSYRKTAETDRIRRLTIAGRIEALQHLLPKSTEGARESVMDDVIGYITYLQLQLKELTQSRLGGELSSNPFISLERHGRDQIDEMIRKETLDEMIGNLLVTHPSEATQLLESKGLVIMPMHYAADLPNKPTN